MLDRFIRCVLACCIMSLSYVSVLSFFFVLAAYTEWDLAREIVARQPLQKLQHRSFVDVLSASLNTLVCRNRYIYLCGTRIVWKRERERKLKMVPTGNHRAVSGELTVPSAFINGCDERNETRGSLFSYWHWLGLVYRRFQTIQLIFTRW